MWEAGIEDVALPICGGRMISQFDFGAKGRVSGKGRRPVWREILWVRKQVEPQHLMGLEDYRDGIDLCWRPEVGHMDIGSATNAHTATGSWLAGMPCGNSALTLALASVRRAVDPTAAFCSLASDFVTRRRVTGLSLSFHILAQNSLVPLEAACFRTGAIADPARGPCSTAPDLAPAAIELAGTDSMALAASPAATVAERRRLQAIADGTIAAAFGLNPRGLLHVDEDEPPAFRHTVLTVNGFNVPAFRVRAADGDRKAGIESFLLQNDGEGWLLPETLRLADYSLCHDDRVRHHQPVASDLGPRFYGWQLVQSPGESRHECHLHARNLAGRAGYSDLIRRITQRSDRSEREHPAAPLSEFARHLQWLDESHCGRGEGAPCDITYTSARNAAESGKSDFAFASGQSLKTGIPAHTQMELFK